MNKIKIKAKVLQKIGEKLIDKNVFFNSIHKDHILVKLYYSGVCGSQLMEIYGGRNNKKFLPHMLGHEGTGKIISFGQNVKNFKRGENVFLSWICSSRKNKVNPEYFDINTKKKINAGKLTTFNNYALVDKGNVYKLGNVSKKTGVLLGCALPTGCGIIENQTYNLKNKKVAIIGLGGVGLSALLASVYKKAKEIYVLEKNLERLENIKYFFKNKKITYLQSSENTLKKYKDFFDIVIECSGKSEIIEKSIKLIKNNGKVIFASHPNKKNKIRLDPFDLILGKKISGSWGGQTKFEKNLPIMRKIIKKFKNIDKLFFTKQYSLNEINKAIRDMKTGKVIRPLIKM